MIKNISIYTKKRSLKVPLVLVCCLLAIIAQMSATIYLPALFDIKKSLALSSAEAAVSFALFVMCSAFGQLIFCGISDIFGRKKIILYGLIFAVLSTLFSAFSFNSYTFIISRCIDGLAVGAIIATSRAVLNDTHSEGALVSAVAISAIVASFASMFSPIIGAVIYKCFDSWASIFIVLSIIGILLFILALRKLPESNLKILTLEKKSFIRPLACNLKEVLTTNNKALSYMLACSLSFTILFTYYVVSPFIFEEGLGLSRVNYSLLFLLTSGAFITGATSGKFLSRHFSQYSLISSAVYVLLCETVIFLLLYSIGIYDILSMLIYIIIAVFCVGLIFPLAMSKGVSYYKHLSGAAAAIMGFLQMFCSAIGMLVISFLPKTNPVFLFLRTS